MATRAKTTPKPVRRRARPLTRRVRCALSIELRQKKQWTKATASWLKIDSLYLNCDQERSFEPNELVEFRVHIGDELVHFHGQIMPRHPLHTGAGFEVKLYGVARDHSRSRQWMHLIRSAAG